MKIRCSPQTVTASFGTQARRACLEPFAPSLTPAITYLSGTSQPPPGYSDRHVSNAYTIFLDTPREHHTQSKSVIQHHTSKSNLSQVLSGLLKCRLKDNLLAIWSGNEEVWSKVSGT